MTVNKIESLILKLDALKDHFIPDALKDEFNAYLPWDRLNDAQKYYISAYIALCHAEIETHFEQWASYILETALDKWQNGKQITLPLLSLSVHYKFIDKNNQTTDTKIHSLAEDFQKSRISQNHGIKGENITKLFRPLGIEQDVIASITPALDNFGKKRGEVVHQSMQVQQPLDIPTIIQDVANIQQGIRELEQSLAGIFGNGASIS